MSRMHPARAPEQKASTMHSLNLLPESIANGVVTLPGGEQRAVLEIAPLGLRLLSPEASEALEEAYHKVLSGLSFPVQIVVRAVPATAQGYLSYMRAALAREPDPALVRVLLAHLSHAERMVATAAPLDRRFYVVVPAPNAVTMREGARRQDACQKPERDGEAGAQSRALVTALPRCSTPL